MQVAMWALLKKEIAGFFSSLTGYLAIAVFLVITGLFLWVLPTDHNILLHGYATLDSLFFLAPWLFLFLVPAITMRLLADEQKMGTIELLYTKPLTDLDIVLAKYFAGLSLVVFSLVPTFIYFLSVYLLGEQTGNIDVGGTWGSYIGLFFLAAIYTAIGIFASSLTDNQIVAFLVAAGLCFVFYIGFDFISDSLGASTNWLSSLGINEHYKSLSRGVVDSRDLVYFIGVIVLFNTLTKTKLESRKW